MNASQHKFEIALPWPQCWEKMQWDIAAWISQHDQRAQVHVIWNESVLKAQVSTLHFQEMTKDFLQALQKRLGKEFIWQFDSTEESSTHKLILGVSNWDRP